MASLLMSQHGQGRLVSTVMPGIFLSVARMKQLIWERKGRRRDGGDRRVYEWK
jgi:hypothetical protein